MTEPTLEDVITEALQREGRVDPDFGMRINPAERHAAHVAAKAVRKLLATRQAGWQKPNGELQEFVPDNSNNVHFPSQGWRPLFALPDKETP